MVLNKEILDKVVSPRRSRPQAASMSISAIASFSLFIISRISPVWNIPAIPHNEARLMSREVSAVPHNEARKISRDIST